MRVKFLVAACLVSPLSWAEPIYKCKGADGAVVFQQVACTADKLDSLADTATSESFRRAEILRQQERDKQEAERQKRLANLEKRATETEKAEIADEEKRVEDEKLGVTYLQLCIDGDEDCSIGSVAGMVMGMSMGALEGVLGEGREQSIMGEKIYYYPIAIKGNGYTLQVQYEVNYTKTASGGRVGNCVSEVNYY